jgi:hypothetical protein
VYPIAASDPVFTGSTDMPPYVVLRHQTPDGSAHLDWMLATTDDLPDPDVRSLVTFRTPVIPGQADAFDAERIPDHRVHYLTYEGPLSGGRGDVRRIAAGSVVWIRNDDAAMTVCLDDALTLDGEATPGPHWRFRRVQDTG